MTRFFVHKAWLGGLGLVAGLLGMALSLRWMVWAAVSLLAAAFVLRLAEAKP